MRELFVWGTNKQTDMLYFRIIGTILLSGSRERAEKTQAEGTRRDNDEEMDCESWSTCQTQRGFTSQHWVES